MAEIRNLSLTAIEKEIILQMADCDLKMAEVGKRIGYCRGAVFYHSKRIHQKTGLNPRSFYDLLLLLDMVKEEGVVNG